MGAGIGGGITVKQQETVDELKAKKIAKGKITDNQQSELDALEAKKIAPKSLPKGCISYLEQLHREIVWGRRKEIFTKAMEKGIAQEEKALTMLSLSEGYFFKKNETRLNNDFITGEFDTAKGSDIYHITHGYDTKCSWDCWTFPYPSDVAGGLDGVYEWQNHGYMWLTGAPEWTTAYCLVNTPKKLIEQAKKSFMYSCPENISEEKLAEVYANIEKSMIYDDIPEDQRIVKFNTKRDEIKLQWIESRVAECRAYMNTHLFKIETQKLQSA
jgi:hypothetical protein